ncbi:MAG: nitroreductase [Ruminococcaceae bacterium]|nr:nitroreductase [Oscillospiraceae bacterium]
MLDLKNLIDKNRSHREFKAGVKIPRERIEAWILNASHCPAARNLQAIKYMIIDSDETVAELLPLTFWAASLGKKLPPEGHGPCAFIVMCHDHTIAPLTSFFYMDIGICAQTIMLSAANEGFGGCMIGSASVEAVKNLLSLPENLEPALILGLGAPEDEVVLTASAGDVKYYRDENNVHYVPKRTLDEIILK